MKYRKKPIVIEAVQLTWSNWSDICVFVSEAAFGDRCYIDPETGRALPDGRTSEVIGLHLNTLEGRMLARENDWIIKGVNGEFYPCKPDIFDKTYEPCGELVAK